MAETNTDERLLEGEYIEFKADGSEPLSSTEVARGFAAELAPAESLLEAAASPVFKELASPTLPPLQKENRARLQMQSPSRIFFYWTLRNNPFQTLSRAFGSETGSYTLVIKLVDLRLDTEEIYRADLEGSWWFDVRPGGEYRAEIGFFAPNRPYVRVLYSNTVSTPRQGPSPRPAESAQWSVSADKFSRVLNAAGFARDAFDVAIAGDDEESSQRLTRAAFARFAGAEDGVGNVDASELRYALAALASGMKLEALRGRVSSDLFAFLQSNRERATAGRALDVLREQFGVEAEDVTVEETGAAVFGASLVNFPRVLRMRRGPLPSPLGSHSFRP